MSEPIRDDSTRAFAEQFPLNPLSTTYEPCGFGCQQVLTSDPLTNQLWVEQQKVATLVSAIDRIEASTVERNSAIDAAIALAKRYRVEGQS